MLKKIFLKRFICFLFVTLIIISCCSCGKKQKTNQLSAEEQYKQNLEAQLKDIVTKEYNQIIQSSTIVSPYAIINSFNKNHGESVDIFNNVMLAIEIKGEDILYGRVYLEDEASEENRYYCFFSEGFEDETVEKNRTNFVISIDKQDEDLIPFGLDNEISVKTVDENGQEIVVNETIPRTIEKFFLVGKINKVIGDIEFGDEKINIVMLDARLVPATTYKALEIAVGEETQSSEILDTSSGESIIQNSYLYRFGNYDFDDNGFCDELNVRIDEFVPKSSLDKLIRSDILRKIDTPIDTLIKVVYGKHPIKEFKINYPLRFVNLTVGECTSFEGKYTNYIKVKLNGLQKDELIFDKTVNKDSLLKNFENLRINPFYLKEKEVYYSIFKEGAKEIFISLLNGQLDNASFPTKVWLNNTNVLMSGRIEGDNYAYTNYPFNLIYKPSFYFYGDGLIKEEEANQYVFFDYDSFVNNDTLIEIKSQTDFDFISKTNIYVCKEKLILESFDNNTYFNSNVEYGNGYYYLLDEYNQKILKTTDIFFTGTQKFKFCSIEKDLNNEGIYWLEVLSENNNHGYIPIKMSGNWTNPNTQYQFFDNVSDKGYSLFESGKGYTSIFEKIEN